MLDTHDDNPPDNDNWHTDVTFIETPPALAILAAKQLPPVGGDTLWASGIAAFEGLSPACSSCWQDWRPNTTSLGRSRPIATAPARPSTSAGRRRWPVTRRCATLWFAPTP